MNKRIYLAIASITITLIVSITWLTSMTNAKPARIDPLPSWNQGVVKQSIIDFVTRITTKGSPDFVPVEDRIATFDNVRPIRRDSLTIATQ